MKILRDRQALRADKALPLALTLDAQRRLQTALLACVGEPLKPDAANALYNLGRRIRCKALKPIAFPVGNLR